MERDPFDGGWSCTYESQRVRIETDKFTDRYEALDDFWAQVASVTQEMDELATLDVEVVP